MTWLHHWVSILLIPGWCWRSVPGFKSFFLPSCRIMGEDPMVPLLLFSVKGCVRLELWESQIS